MSYDQAMHHSRNHRKDRFYQQCSGYFGDGTPSDFSYSKKEFAENSAKSMAEILKTAAEFPVYLHQQRTGEWELVPGKHWFGQEIGSREELYCFAKDYVGIGEVNGTEYF